MKVTEYKLSAPHAFSHGPQDTITLPQGAFVKPLQHQYVPQHILNKSENMGYNTMTSLLNQIINLRNLFYGSSKNY